MRSRTIFGFWIFYSLGILSGHYASAQSIWPHGKKAAIVLTYDDGITSQLQTAIPRLNQAGLSGTFFLDAEMTDSEILLWRAAAKKGHELANHTLFHPCSEKTLKLHPHYINENYDPHVIIREISLMNNLLFAIDGRTRRTYAYPCCETIVGGKDYVDTLRSTGLVDYARVGGDKVPVTDIKNLDLFRVPSWAPVDVNDPALLIDYAEKTLDSGGLGVFQFHGVGGDYLEVSTAAHQGLLDYLKNHPEIWVGTFREVMDYVKDFQSGKK